jgi:hypothetical protein
LVKIIANQVHKIAPVGARPLFVVTLVACLVLTAALRLHASASDQIDKAVALSQAWVAQIDAAKYDDSYSFVCEETRNKFPEDRWILVLQTIRTPWGGVVNRHQLSHVYKPHGVQGLDGECVVVTYSTDFKNRRGITEMVVLKWEDGQWRGASYFAGVPADPNAPSQDDGGTTQVQTQEHVKLQPNSQ